MYILKKFHRLKLKNGMCIPFHSISFQKKKLTIIRKIIRDQKRFEISEMKIPFH